MLELMTGRFDQIAFITTDVDETTALFRDRYGVPRFQVGEQQMQASERGAPVPLSLKVAQVMLDGAELEIIEDTGSGTDFFRRGLPDDGRFAHRLHHVQFQIVGARELWDRHLAALVASHPPRLSGGTGEDLRFAFTDETGVLGINFEYVWFSPAQKKKMESVPGVRSARG
ncbi:hypothetical protein tb265_10790 [Gemmatimonadetes bacterium T265]|nr:hypothetical protein tb265_10790 [Gemmatimonadetes bacterium T265]